MNQEYYTKHYIVTALFKLMHTTEYSAISISDITSKAGVGRATFYRHFKTKEDVILYWFNLNKDIFENRQKFIPRCKEDYREIILSVMTHLKEQKEPFKLLVRAHLEYLYLQYLNARFSEMFRSETKFPKNAFYPIGYASMLFNVSIQWILEDCATPIEEVAEVLLSEVYPS